MAFSPFVEIPSASGAYVSVSGDFTGDNKIDFAVASNSAGLVLQQGNGDGTFQSPTSIAVEPALTVAAGDLDQDGDLDLATERNVYLNRGDGTFEPPTAIALPDQLPYGYPYLSPQYPSSVAVGDIDADGKLDLLVTGRTWVTVYAGPGYYGPYFNTYSSGHVNVLLGNGDGTAQAAIVTGFAEQQSTRESLALAQLNDDDGDGDVDGDDRVDLVVRHPGSGATDALLGHGDGSFEPTVRSATQNADRVVLGDFDEDGFLDLLSHNNTGLNLKRGLPGGAFEAGISIDLAGSPSIPRSLAVGDIDGDGNLDIAVTTQRAYIPGYGYYDNPYPYYGIVQGTIHEAVKVLLGNGDGGFAAPIASTLGVYDGYTGSVYSSELVDVDGDDRLDLTILNRQQYRFTVALNDGHWTPPASLSIDDVEVVEGDSGQQLAVFTVTASAHQATVDVEYTTGDISATAGADFATTNGTLTFAPGVFTRTIEVPIYGDRFGEFGETFSLTLANSSGAIVVGGAGIGTILDNEPSVSIDHPFGSDPLTAVEGDVGTTPAIFTVALSAPYDQVVTVDYYTLTGHTNDIVAASGTVRFLPGETSKQIAIEVVGDLIHESLEAFNVYLTNPSANASLGNSAAYCYIEDNDPLPTATIDDVSKKEGHSGKTRFTFTVTLSAPVEWGYVEFATSHGTANAQDYVAKSGNVYFSEGQTTARIAIDVKGDTSKEANETFFVNLLSAYGATIADGQGVGTILNDDGKSKPAMRISDTQVVEGDGGTKLMLFRVRLAEASDDPVTVRYRTRNGAATYQNRDYVADAGELRFAPGERTKTIAIRIRGDRHVESDEDLIVELSSAFGAVLADRRGRGVIRNNDA